MEKYAYGITKGESQHMWKLDQYQLSMHLECLTWRRTPLSGLTAEGCSEKTQSRLRQVGGEM